MGALAQQIAEVDFVVNANVGRQGERGAAGVEQRPVGAVDDLLGAAADDVPLDRDTKKRPPEPGAEGAPPGRVDGHELGAQGRGHALEQFEGGGQAVDAGAGEGQAAVAAEADEVEAGQVGRVKNGARVAHHDAVGPRLELPDAAAGAQVLIAHVAGGAGEEPHLVFVLRAFVAPEVGPEGEERGGAGEGASGAGAGAAGRGDEGGGAERGGGELPGDGGHEVALVLPAHLAVERDEQRPGERAREQERGGGPATRVGEREEREGERPEPGPRALAEVVEVNPFERIAKVEEIVVELLFGRHVRVVERELDERAVGRKFARQPAVGERLQHERGGRRRERAQGEPERPRRPAAPEERPGGQAGDRGEGLGSCKHKGYVRCPEPPGPALPGPAPGPQLGPDGQGGPPEAQEEGDLHAAPERPAEGPYRDQGQGQEQGGTQGQACEEAQPSPHVAQGRHCRHQCSPDHEPLLAEACGVAEGENEGVGEAGVAARIAAAFGPGEGLAAGGRARVIEVNEDVVEGG